MSVKSSDRSRKTGLDDPGRVDKIYDRGQRFLPPQSATTSSVSSSTKGDIKSIGEDLDTSVVQSAFDSDKSFIPHDKLLEVLTPDTVRNIVRGLECFGSHIDRDKIAKEIHHGSKSRHNHPCLKLLATLIYIEKVNDIAKHMADGLNDSCFPLNYNGSGRKSISCKRHGESHKTINEYRLHYREDFSRWSYRLSAPFIKWRKEIHSHYILDSSDVFPIIDVQGALSGGFSEIQKVKLHKSHFDFGGHGIRHPEGFFALKKLNPGDDHLDDNRESFNMELSSLLFSQDKGFGAQEHLIQVLATFEVLNPAPQHSTWYFLFDWAEGNLTDFWRRNQCLVRDHNHLPWMAKQLHGLTKALKCVHNERKQTLNSFDIKTRVNSNTLYGRHGDISVGNFLWFPSDPFPGTFSLADFGLGRLHRQVSRSERDPRSIARTATYRAPEFDLDKPGISRMSDIFSLGCVFLEYVIWFFFGFEGVEQSSKDRIEPDIYGFRADTFFTFNREAAVSERQFFVKQSVKDLIQQLKRDQACSEYLSQLLDIIDNNMLEPNPSRRIDAVRLEREMKELCKTQPEFYNAKKKSTS